ncbi:MAG: arginine deiminase family protein [Bacillota bacterium]
MQEQATSGRLSPSAHLGFGLKSETGYLQSVLVHRPGEEVNRMDEKYPWRWICDGKPDLAKAQAEHDEMCEMLRKEGADVIYLDPWEPRTEVPVNQWFTRDHGFMTPYGAVIGNCDHPREGEELFVTRRLLDLDVPVIGKVFGSGRLEGGDVLYLNGDILLVGLSYRTNVEGFTQVKRLLEGTVVREVVAVPLARDIMHLDTVFNIASKKVAAACKGALPEGFLRFVSEQGFDVIEVPEEEQKTLATNWLCVGPGRVVFIDGDTLNVSTRRALEKKGIDIIPFRMPALLPGAGGPRCMTFPLARWRNDL